MVTLLRQYIVAYTQRLKIIVERPNILLE
jgi:hypothetical protein